MKTCDNCGQALPENGPITVSEVLAAIEVAAGGDRAYYWGKTLESTPLTLRGQQVHPVLVTREVPPSSLFDYEGQQGVEYPLSVVFSLEGDFYLKTGTADSYGEQMWDGQLKKVKPTEKTITVYE